MKLQLIFFFLLCFLNGSASGQCSIKNTAFKSDEKLEYDIVYNWGFIWISAGKVTFSVKNQIYNNKPVYLIDAVGSTHKGFDWFFRVRDYFHAYIDTPTLVPFWAERNTSEGSYSASEVYLFNNSEQKIFMAVKTSRKPFYLDTLQIKGCLYDILSAAFHARNIDYSMLNLNDKFPLWTVLDGKIYPIYICYDGKETITGENHQKYNCIKLYSEMVEGTIFKKGERLTIWISDDPNHIPILAEAKILVGSVKAVLVSAENLKNPFSSRK
jgi:hypothetical protein